MGVKQLLLRCFAKKIDGDQWAAVCLELNLAAQASSFEDAVRKLEDMIHSYVKEALEEDHQYADQLLQRRAPMSLYIEYYKAKMMHHINHTTSKLFTETLPLKVA